MPGAQGPLDGARLSRRGELDALEGQAQVVDDLGGQAGQVGEGALADLAAFPVRLSQQDGGRRVPVWDGVYMHDDSIP